MGAAMKVSIDIDCTPEEARTFLGLPDVQPMQAALMKQVEERMASALAASDPEQLMKTWLPMGVHNLEQLQKLFWTQMASGFGGDNGRAKK